MKLPADFRAGVRDATPLLLGITPFALVAGIATVNAGLDLRHAVGLSVMVFAGASQLATLDLLGRGAPVAVVVLTATVINLRMMMYSASIAPHFRRQPARWKAILAYLLTDMAYALSVARYNQSDVDKRLYYFGASVVLWAVWQIGTVAGVLLGNVVPQSWGLEFAVPLVFLALLVSSIEDQTTCLAALVGGVVAIAGADLPLNLGLLAGASIGMIAGYVAETMREADGS